MRAADAEERDGIAVGGEQIGCDDDSCGRDSRRRRYRRSLLPAMRIIFVVWQTGSPAGAGLYGGSASDFKNNAAGATIRWLGQWRVAGHSGDGARPCWRGMNMSWTGRNCFSGIGQIGPPARRGGNVVYSFTAPTNGNYSIKVANLQ